MHIHIKIGKPYSYWFKMLYWVVFFKKIKTFENLNNYFLGRQTVPVLTQNQNSWKTLTNKGKGKFSMRYSSY